MKIKKYKLAGNVATLPLFWRGGLVLLLVLLAGPQLLLAQEQPRPLPAKLAPGLQGPAAQRGPRTVRVSVTDNAIFQQWMRQHLPAARVSQPSASPRILAVEGVDAAALALLAACPWVNFVDMADRRAHEERRLSNSDLSVNAIALVQARYPQLGGQGLTVSVKEQPFDSADIDFKGRVVAIGRFPKPASDHATAMATLIGGAGNSDPLGRGVANAVRLATSDFARLLPDDGPQLTQAGVSVQNHSYGVAIENYYGIEAQEYDRQCQLLPTLVHVFSSGNSGSQVSPTGPYQGLANFANLTGQFKMSKNTLSVGATDPSGAVNALSSRGPAYDGRVKPELVAYGEGGSSESAALVSGISTLLQQTYRDLHGGTLPPAALVKAVLLNSADDLGQPEVDYLSGFGQADALGAIATMRDGHHFAGTATQGTDQVFTLTVPAGRQQLKATLTWSDPAATANAALALVNDLDVELVNVGTGQRWLPWSLSAAPNADSLARPARRRPDHLNNTEQITLGLPAPGTYELHVRGYAVPQGPQAFSLAYEINPPGLTWLSPPRPTNLVPGVGTALHWQWSGPATTARLEYQPIGSPKWRVVNTAVSLTANRLTWAVPDTTTLAQLRLVAGSSSFVSDTFAIVQVPPLQVGYACPDAVLLQWVPVPGATGYQVYQLGSTNLMPLVQTADTTLALSGAQLTNHYYAVAPVLRGRVVRPSGTIDYATQGTACYFRSFRPRQLVTDAVTFDLEIGTISGLKSATLERLGAGGYVAVSTIAPVRRLNMVFTDQLPGPDRYLYRLRLETTAGQLIFSQTEEVYYVRQSDLLVFPNPVAAGESLRLIAGDQGAVQTMLYDALGRLQRTGTADGTIINVDTSGLRPGVYLLRVQTKSGSLTTRRIVVL